MPRRPRHAECGGAVCAPSTQTFAAGSRARAPSRSGLPERFGFRFDTAARLLSVPGLLYRAYFRVECHGIETLPPGPVLLAANHGSHVLSWDGAMIVSACLLEADRRASCTGWPSTA